MTRPRCTRCLTPDHATLHPELRGDTLCPACAAADVLDDACARHLTYLLRPIVKQWAQHWHAAGLNESTLAANLEVVGKYWHEEGMSGEDAGPAALIREALEDQPYRI